jgi:hypothetical protein
VRRTICTVCGKLRFGERWEAVAMSLIIASESGAALREYWSKDCRCFHLTSGSPGKKRREKLLSFWEDE